MSKKEMLTELHTLRWQVSRALWHHLRSLKLKYSQSLTGCISFCLKKAFRYSQNTGWNFWTSVHCTFHRQYRQSGHSAGHPVLFVMQLCQSFLG